MEITQRYSGEYTVLGVKGRLDGYWADHLANALKERIRGGSHRIRCDLSEVDYISSAGIGALVACYNQLKEIQGSFAVINPSERVMKLLVLSKLDNFLLAPAEAAAPAKAEEAASEHHETENARYEIFETSAGSAIEYQVTGRTDLLQKSAYTEEHCRTLSFSKHSFAVGLGAFGNDFADARKRFGEFLAIAGAVTYLPSDGTNVPDYMVASETFVPEAEVLYCISGEGSFSHLVRFEAKSRSVSLSELVSACFDRTGANTAAFAIIAESAGLVGAALKRSPAMPDCASSPFEHPGIRQWLSFSAEPVHSRSLALVAGAATRVECEPLSSIVRPLGELEWPAGHFHAAVFSYRPLRKGVIELHSAARSLFESETPRDVLHLLCDTRDIKGAGQSHFVRGACWVGPLVEPAVRAEEPVAEAAEPVEEKPRAPLLAPVIKTFD